MQINKNKIILEKQKIEIEKLEEKRIEIEELMKKELEEQRIVEEQKEQEMQKQERQKNERIQQLEKTFRIDDIMIKISNDLIKYDIYNKISHSIATYGFSNQPRTYLCNNESSIKTGLCNLRKDIFNQIKRINNERYIDTFYIFYDTRTFSGNQAYSTPDLHFRIYIITDKNIYRLYNHKVNKIFEDIHVVSYAASIPIYIFDIHNQYQTNIIQLRGISNTSKTIDYMRLQPVYYGTLAMKLNDINDASNNREKYIDFVKRLSIIEQI